MVLTFEQEKEMENLKHEHRMALIATQLGADDARHRLRMKQLEKELEIHKENNKAWGLVK